MIYDLWDVLRPLEKFIDFKALEQKILTLQEMIDQGLASDKVIDAMKNNSVNISAVFHKKGKQHKLFIKGIKIIDVKKNFETGLSIIDVKDVEVDGISIVKDGSKIFGIII